MLHTQLDIKKINALKDILHRLSNGEAGESIRVEIETYFKNAKVIDILLTEQELINKDYRVTSEDVRMLSRIYPHLYSTLLNKEIIAQTSETGHPIQIMLDENIAFQSILNQINLLLESFEKNSQRLQESKMTDEVKQLVFQLGAFHKHYHRKEKLFFPVLERYGYYAPARIMWKGDDRIRALYQAVKGLVSQLPSIDFERVLKTYASFEHEFSEMIFQEEALLLPIVQSVFNKQDWLRIAKESNAFGYALINVEKEWMSKSDDENKTISNIAPNQNIALGSGYLTTEEVNLVLNNLPLEITFVDKNSMFKYFNEITTSSEMMLVRTPLSIGRNVANCHPPKSLKKVMTLIRDLKTKKRASESMWFKKKDEYIHITYKGIFNEQDEFLGILEYVQDIQPFLDLPSDVKTRLSKVEE